MTDIEKLRAFVALEKKLRFLQTPLGRDEDGWDQNEGIEPYELETILSAIASVKAMLDKPVPTAAVESVVEDGCGPLYGNDVDVTETQEGWDAALSSARGVTVCNCSVMVTPISAENAVERVAKALYFKDELRGRLTNIDVPTWGGIHQDTRDYWTELARAAISALSALSAISPTTAEDRST